MAASRTSRCSAIVIVCLCHRISDRDIQRAVRDGVRDFEELQDDTCIARNCGCCHDCAREIFDTACEAARPVVVHAPVHAAGPKPRVHRLVPA